MIKKRGVFVGRVAKQGSRRRIINVPKSEFVDFDVGIEVRVKKAEKKVVKT